MIDTYKSELGPHADELANMMTSMKDAEASEPMLQLLSCAAAAGKESVVALEKSYQERKRLKTSLDATEKKLQAMATPAFSQDSERFVAPPPGPRGPPRPRLPQGMSLPPVGGAGMQARNPNLWAELSGSTGPGMGWFSEKNIVGKEYTEGRRPKTLV